MHGEVASVVTAQAFKGWTSSLDDGSATIIDDRTGLTCLHVRTLTSLIQALGYKKFVCRDKGVRIFYRGQTELYNSFENDGATYLFQPYALRGYTRPDAVLAVYKKMDAKVAAVRKMSKKLFGSARKYPGVVIEGLLQQYGIPTTLVDIVDNIWVALWFACFKNVFPVDVATADKVERKFIRMERRTPAKEPRRSRFAYIMLLGESDGAEILDLRYTIPSFFIRPHVQHGLLMRLKNREQYNMASLIRGIIRIDLEDALNWLGEGRILTTESMVPPPNYDAGYKLLLSSEAYNSEDPLIRFPIYC